MELNLLLRKREARPAKGAKTRPTHALAPGLSNIELAAKVRERCYEARNYARQRRRTWSTGASIVQICAFSLSTAATIALGLATRDLLSSIGFVLSALVTVTAALEPFYNWRSRWVNADEALARWHRIEENLELYVSETSASKLNRNTILEFEREYRVVWDQLSESWLDARRSFAN